jgi:hypothetical protein
VALGPLILALFNGSSFGVGGARVAYNLAMFIFSPIAGAMAERVAIRYLLNLTTTFRLVLYVMCIPHRYSISINQPTECMLCLTSLLGRAVAGVVCIPAQWLGMG